MHGYRPLADEQCTGDLAVAVPAGEQGQHLHLPAGEVEPGRAARRVRLRQQAPIPGLIPSPSPSALPTSDTSNLPAMSCANAMAVATDDHVGQPIAYVSAVRVGTHKGYDRITVEFKNGLPGDIQLSTQSSAVFTQSASGRQVTLLGSYGLLVTLTGADDHTSYAGSTDFQTNYPGLLEARQVQDFEGYVQWGLGLAQPACYRAFVLQGPTRLVVDVANM